SQLADTRKELDQAKKSTNQVADLQKQNKDLNDQLVAAKKDAATKVAAARAVDSSQLKQIRAEADSARADLEKTRKTVADLEKRNANLSTEEAAAKKQTEEEEDTTMEPADGRIW
ncbi:MAG: hypothetical protein ACLP0A_07210, partial [Verrucomicrobiia bacterium]